jgi:N5-(cytidine 5'-diphosphoramidyl)-L-glutamine hydrolase
MNVGISQRMDIVSGYDEVRDSLDQRMVRWVISIGFIPILIPNSLVDETTSATEQLLLKKWIKSVQLDALILSGGNDIGQMGKRDLTELVLLRWAEDSKVPVLGICRGMQMMGLYSGGSLEEVDFHVKVRHELQFDPAEGLFPKEVNSYHNQRLTNCPPAFRVLAKSEDGTLEAMAHEDLPWEGWMWHPEREEVICSIDSDRFKRVIMNGK